MSGEHGREGYENTKMFSTLATIIGWRLRGSIDSKIPCPICERKKAAAKDAAPATKEATSPPPGAKAATSKEPKAAKEKIAHADGINLDAIFTIKCPFTKRNRGILVDGKRHAMGSVEPHTLRSDTDKLEREISHIREAKDVLYKQLNIDESTVFDTGILAWYCHDGWNEATANDHIRKVQSGAPRRLSIQILIANNTLLDRLGAVANFIKTQGAVEFFYKPTDHFSKTLAPEYLMSDLIPLHYKQRASDLDKRSWRTGFLVFGIDTPYIAHIRFLVKFANHVFSGHDNIDLFIDLPATEFARFKEEFESSQNYDAVASEDDEEADFGGSTKFNLQLLTPSAFTS